MLETCLGTSNYPRVTIWGIGMAYFGQSVEEATKNRYWQDLGELPIPLEILHKLVYFVIFINF